MPITRSKARAAQSDGSGIVQSDDEEVRMSCGMQADGDRTGAMSQSNKRSSKPDIGDKKKKARSMSEESESSIRDMFKQLQVSIAHGNESLSAQIRKDINALDERTARRIDSVQEDVHPQIMRYR